jgi:hypothetical protein
MDYNTAHNIVVEHAPELILSPEVPGQKHIDVRKTARDAPFSITLPHPTAAVPLTAEEERALFIASLDAAKVYFG